MFFLFLFLDPWLTKTMNPGHYRSSVVRLCIVVRFLGLDGIDHLGLGGALRRAWTVFRYGIHTWHHCRYVIIILYFTLPPPLCDGGVVSVSSILSFFTNCIGSGLYALAFGIMGLLPAPRVAR